MNQIFWLRRPLVAGRPGPNRHRWDLESLRREGITSILSVNNGEGCHLTLMETLGIRYANIPMSRNAPAKAGDKEYCLNNLPAAINFIEEGQRLGSVLIHCRSGKDRTGLVMAAFLIATENKTAEDAMKEVLLVRPIAFSAEGWMGFCQQILVEFDEQGNYSANS